MIVICKNICLLIIQNQLHSQMQSDDFFQVLNNLQCKSTIFIFMDIENQQDKKTEERMRCLFAHMYIVNSKFHKLYPSTKQSRNLLDTSVGTLSHKRKKVNEKLVSMKFLKDNKNIVLGYDKTSERGDINFIDASEPKISDFYYNKLQGGLGGLSCFQDGRFILAADKKGVFAYVDLSKGPNIDDIKANSVQTVHEGVLDICLSPFQTKVVCGMSDNKCLIIDLGKDKARSVPSLNRKFSHHVYGVNSVCWHPYKSLILSSSLDINDSIKLWDPHSEHIVQEINLHNNATITRSLFHPVGNTFFSIGKDNSVYEYEIRFSGPLHKFKLDHEPTALEIMHNGNIVIGDSNGSLSWYDRLGSFLKKVDGSSAVSMMSADWSRSLLAVGREREHTFEFYTYEDAFDLELQ